MSTDYAGMGIMQELRPENKENSKSYLFPLPDGLHSNSDELFGFFTYEIRVGHKKEFWSTAQARFGRPLKVQGVQHPAPELTCSVYRSEDKELVGNEKYIEIAAIYANAISDGEVITAYPSNTSLWYLLYTQVMQADGKSYRNLLIDSGEMPFKINKREIKNAKKLANKMGIAKVSIKDIGNKLQQLGLPRSNNISVLTVEMFPLNNKWKSNKPFIQEEGYSEEIKIERNPLTDLLEQYRIYRTSKLTSITEICCEDC